MTIPSDDPLTQVLATVVAPLVAVDGGRIALLGRREGVVEIALEGACQGCPGRNYTTRDVVLPALQAADPTVTEVRVRWRAPRDTEAPEGVGVPGAPAEARDGAE